MREAAQAVVDDAQVVSSADRIIVPQYVVSCDVLDALRSALAEPEWIPVSERVPEWDGREYWVAYRDYKNEEAWIIQARRRSKRLPWTVWWASVRCDVLYWKRIYHEPPPDPPTE